MWNDALLITVAAVLAVQMGLVDAAGRVLRYRFRILSCPKCATFWCSLAWHLLSGRGPVESVGVSFLSSYLALWLVLLYDRMAVLYNKAYGKVIENEGGIAGEESGEKARADRRPPVPVPSPGPPERKPGQDAVPEVREMKRKHKKTRT